MFQRRHSFTTYFFDDFYSVPFMYFLVKIHKKMSDNSLKNDTIFQEHTVWYFSSQRQQLVAKISFAIDQKRFGNFDDKLTQHSIELWYADVDNKGNIRHVTFCCYSFASIVFDGMTSSSIHSLKNLIHEKFWMMHNYLFQLNMFSNSDEIILEIFKWNFNIHSSKY